jgi:asparagine synthase (glutamine-hydrolysing)
MNRKNKQESNMCGIVGINGENVGSDLKEMLVSLKHRGPDGSGVSVDGKILHGDLEILEVPEGSFGLGHNLLSIVGSEVHQPIKRDRFIMVCNGEIYNFKELEKNFKLNLRTDSDCEIIIGLIEKFYNESLQDAVEKTIKYLDGDYAFAVYDGENFAAVRDPLGVKPLYFASLNEVSNKKVFAFASERKALWSIGMENVETLSPACMIYNGVPVELGDRSGDLHQWAAASTSKSTCEPHFKLKETKPEETKPEETKSEKTFNELKCELKDLLIKSVEKRVRNLSEVGIIFSGGVDSTLLARITLDLGVETSLYSVGRSTSSDLKFAQKAALDMHLPLKIHTVEEEDVKKYCKLVLKAIEEFNVMKLGVGMPSYIASEMGHMDGLKVMLSGQGADELFAGYNRYLKFYQERGEQAAEDLKSDVLNLYHVNLQRDDAVTMANSVELRVPYLDHDIVNLAMEMPMKYKIRSFDDRLRKHILREVAAELGVPDEIVKRPKKAAQYGSGIHKILVKKVLRDETCKNELEQYLKGVQYPS